MPPRSKTEIYSKEIAKHIKKIFPFLRKPNCAFQSVLYHGFFLNIIHLVITGVASLSSQGTKSESPLSGRLPSPFLLNPINQLLGHNDHDQWSLTMKLTSPWPNRGMILNCDIKQFRTLKMFSLFDDYCLPLKSLPRNS